MKNALFGGRFLLFLCKNIYVNKLAISGALSFVNPRYCTQSRTHRYGSEIHPCMESVPFYRSAS
jgi:hypothetical protein